MIPSDTMRACTRCELTKTPDAFDAFTIRLGRPKSVCRVCCAELSKMAREAIFEKKPRSFPARMAKRRERQEKRAEAFATLEPHEKLAYIPRPGGAPSEFEVQSFLFNELLNLGYVVRGEVATKCGTCVLDLVIYRDGLPVKILEVKKHRRGKGSSQERKKQIERYEQFGVPVEGIFAMAQAKDYINRVTATKLL